MGDGGKDAERGERSRNQSSRIESEMKSRDGEWTGLASSNDAGPIRLSDIFTECVNFSEKYKRLPGNYQQMEG